MIKNKRKIKEFWEERAILKPSSKLVTHRDVDQVTIEIDKIYDLLTEDDKLMDIGCGSGYSTRIYAQKCKKVLGIDYSNNMIDVAKKNYIYENLNFKCQDVTKLSEFDEKYSVVLSTRCLINLDSWEKQKDTIVRIHRCLNNDGKFILAEGTLQGRQNLNNLRTKVGLEEMPPVWHNLDFDEEKLDTFMNDIFTLEDTHTFGFYDVLTRVQYPLSIFPEAPQFGTSFHNATRKLFQSFSIDPLERYSRMFIRVYRKK